MTFWNLREPERFYAAQRMQAAAWLRQHTDPGAVVGSWNAGMLGYFSHRHVVNLDGLANDREYFQRVIRDHDLGGYLNDVGVDWLADQACSDEPGLHPYLVRTASEHLQHRASLAVMFG